MFFKKKNVVVWDLDGTLSDGRHRLHLLPKANHHIGSSWDEFNLACGGDAPIQENIQMMNSLYLAGYYVVILTGRCAIASGITLNWLHENNARYHNLTMRAIGDDRKDTEYKEDELRKIGLDRIAACWDDNIKVARHMRSLGLTVYVVTEYDDNDRHDLKCHGTTENKE